jgi:hypothetical protein
MATPIVLELQRLSSDGGCPLTDLLRKALIVATKLNLPDLREWLLAELNGYGGDKELPPYRELNGRMSALTPHGELPLGFGRGREDLDRMISAVPMPAGVAELEQLSQHSGLLYVNLATSAIQALHDAFGNRQFVPQLVISPAAIKGILDTVRNAVLEWSLKLEQQGILGDRMTFSDDERKRAAADPTIHIGYIGSMTGNIGSVSAHNLQIGGFSSINDHLKNAGISQSDRNELENIMDSVKEATPNEKPGVVQRGMDWVGRNAANLGAIAGALRTFFQQA